MKNEQANQREERLIDFGVQIIRLSEKLPRSYAGQHIASQMLRAGTSPAPNYGEARGGESRAELLPVSDAEPLLDECRQLSRMLNASIQTGRQNGH